MDTGKRLRDLLSEVNKSQKWLADQVKIPAQRIWEYCNGGKMPLNHVLKIAYVLGVTTDEVLCFDEYIAETDEKGMTEDAEGTV